MDAHTATAVSHLLESSRPDSVLIVAPEVPACVSQYAAEHSQATVKHVVFRDFEQSLGDLGRYDFAFVWDILDHLEKTDARQLIGRLRDLHARLLWVSVPDAGLKNRFGREDAIAQGMRAVRPGQAGGKTEQLYEFSLQFYKPVPQWLNAENWANPHLWNKRRW